MKDIYIACTKTLLVLETIYFIFIKCDELNPVITVCMKRVSNYNETVIPQLIDIPCRSQVLLICNYCGSNQNEFGAKIWYYQKRGICNSKKEIIPEIKNDLGKSKVYMTPGHTLVINNFQISDLGIYSCQDLEQQKKTFVFTYIIDVRCSIQSKSINGSKTKWLRFKRQKLDPINKLNNHSLDIVLSKLNKMYTISYCWGDWQPCEMYGRSFYRIRVGKCCLRPKVRKPFFDVSPNCLNDKYDVLCSSVVLNNTYPDISTRVRIFPDFYLFQFCNIDSIISKVHTTRLSRATTNKIKSIVRKIPEYGHLVLTCNVFPWSSNIQWYKNNKLLNESFRKNMDADEDPHLFIDTFNTLYILHATKREHGIYICTSNGISMQKINVKVISSSRFLNQDFLRYSVYLAFVLSLTFTCYCAGICVAWHQRSSFADPLHLNTETKQPRDH